MPSSRNAKRRRKQTAGSTTSDDAGPGTDGIATTNKGGAGAVADTTTAVKIDLLDSFQELRKSWPKDMARLFDPALSDDRRAELWEIMCEGGDRLRQRFAWGIPDERALRIVEHFGPVVEIGSGLGYWAMLLRARGVDFNAYDKAAGSPDTGGSPPRQRLPQKGSKSGTPAGTDGGGEKKKKLAEAGEDEEEAPSFWSKVEEGGPDVLEEECNEKRSLFLCYPDDFEGETESLGLRCLHAFEGDVVIHVGELFGDSVSMTPGQTPWGRTTSSDCQEELASKFHCILKVPLPRWPHSRDTLTVWKRHAFCAIHYDDDDSEEEEEEGDDESQDEEAGEGKGDAKKRARGKGQAREADQEDSDESVSSAGSGEPAAAHGAEIAGLKDVKCSRGGGQGGGGGSGSDGGASDDGASDDFGSEEGFPIGMPDLDMYAFLPADEQMSCAQAAPCVRFLLGARNNMFSC
ncbi:unnamed protein product [Laminaria digitata]